MGDKWYAKGEPRTANPLKVKHLVKSGVLIDPDAEKEVSEATDAGGAAEGGNQVSDVADQKSAEKAAKKPANKAEPKTADKAEPKQGEGKGADS
jgi:hypothetical protein